MLHPEERFTFCVEEKGPFIKRENISAMFGIDEEHSVDSLHVVHVGPAVNKLFEYENTGLTPSDIWELINIFTQVTSYKEPSKVITDTKNTKHSVDTKRDGYTEYDNNITDYSQGDTVVHLNCGYIYDSQTPGSPIAPSSNHKDNPWKLLWEREL